jgi:hypothetical protein
MKPSRLAAIWIVTRGFPFSIVTPQTLAVVDTVRCLDADVYSMDSEGIDASQS